MPEITETCPCGARFAFAAHSIAGVQAGVEHFREQHAACRHDEREQVETLRWLLAEAEHHRDQNERRALRLGGKCNAVAQAIGLQPGGGPDGGDLVPAVVRLAHEHHVLRLGLSSAATAIARTEGSLGEISAPPLATQSGDAPRSAFDPRGPKAQIVDHPGQRLWSVVSQDGTYGTFGRLEAAEACLERIKTEGTSS